nr:zinc finger, CCHC-type [Tanacetum cinerariifolium]
MYQLEHILSMFAQNNMNMDGSIQVSSIIDKLPSTWKYVKKKLKHRKDDLSVKHRGKHLLIEEQYRLENKANDDTSKVFKCLKKTMDYGLEYSGDPSVLEEFVALASCCKEAEWLRDFLINITLWPKLMPPISMHCGSQSTLSRAYNQVYNGKSRHIGIRHMQANQLINDRVITISVLRSSKNLADPFTKGLPTKLIESTSQGMGLKLMYK